MTTKTQEIKNRLEYLRAELRAERISTCELTELQSLKEYIDPGDVELLEAAGVPEFEEDSTGHGNKLIAEFMGYKPAQCNNGYAWDCGETKPSKDHLLPIQGRLITGECSYLKFATSWDWLMPVVEKINNDFHKVSIVGDEESDYCEILAYNKNSELDDRICEYGISLLEATYKAVIVFIKWHNNQQA
jgi:hypothetical protein